jgi:hypothetical protein
VTEVTAVETRRPSVPIAPPVTALGADAVALPVVIDLAGPHAEAVRGWVEGVLGWQPVAGDTADLVPAAIRLLDPGSVPSLLPAGRPIPTVLLVSEADTAPVAAAAASRSHPELVLAWPQERERLASAVDALLASSRRPGSPGRVIRVGGAAGGTGTSTVALALAGLSAWSGLRSLAAVGVTAPLGEVVTVAGSALEAPDLWQRATPLPGTQRARAVRVVTDQQPLPEPPSGDLEVAVLDVGVGTDVDVLVCRADAAGLDAAAATTAAAVVVVGDGPASPAAVRRACGGRRRLTLPRSARVERAGLHRRVPGALPGRWLHALWPLVPTAVPAQHDPDAGPSG